MKMFLKVLLISCFVFSFSVLAEKPDESPRFKSGIMNEIFTGIEGAGGQSIITPEDLVGEWTCKGIASASKANDSLIDNSWALSMNGLYLHCLEGTIIFNDNGDGSFSISLPNQDPFYLVTTDISETPPYTVIADTLYRKCYYIINGQTRSSLISFNIKRITQNIIIFKFLNGPGFSSKVVICERVLTP